MREATAEPADFDAPRAEALYESIDGVCDGHTPLEVVTACHCIICFAIATLHPDIERALAAVDALAGDMKQLLRKRMGH